MSSDWKLRCYRDGDEQGILDCLTAAFERWPAVEIDVSPIDHLRWKLCSPGADGLHYLIEADGLVVGTRLLISQQWLVRGQALDCTKSTDLSISKAFRGRGIFPKIWNEHENACRSRYGLSLGFTDVQSLREYMSSMGHRVPANRLEHLICRTEHWRRSEGLARHNVRREGAFDRSIERLVHAAREEFDLLNARSIDYLNWRYSDRRAGRFAVYVVRESGGALGYIVLTTSRDRAFIADLLLVPGRQDVLRALVDEAMRYAQLHGCESLRTWSFLQHPYRKTLLDSGFTPLREETSVSVMSYGSDLGFVFEDPRARLHIVPGDTDIV